MPDARAGWARTEGESGMDPALWELFGPVREMRYKYFLYFRSHGIWSSPLFSEWQAYIYSNKLRVSSWLTNNMFWCIMSGEREGRRILGLNKLRNPFMFSFKGHFQYTVENDKCCKRDTDWQSIIGIQRMHFLILEWRVMLKISTVVSFLFSLLETVTGAVPSVLSIQVILFLIMLVMRKRVALTIALFHVAGKVFIHLPLLVFQPFWTFFALVLFWVYWIMTLLFLGTTGKKTCCFFFLVMNLICIKIF